MIGNNATIKDLQSRLDSCEAAADEFRAQAKFWAEQDGMSAVVAAYEDCAEKLDDALVGEQHESASPNVPWRSVRWPANAAGNFGCVQVPMEAAAEAEKMQQLAKLVNAGVIAQEEIKVMSGGMVYDFGQPMHCRCDVEINHAALPTVELKYNNLINLISIYFESLQHISDFGQASHEAFQRNSQIRARIKNIIREGV